MDSTDEGVQRALSLLRSSQLPHPAEALLSSFVTEAVDPRAAANFVINSLSHRGAPSLVSDWRFIIAALVRHGQLPPEPQPVDSAAIRRRDGNQCCISGRGGSIWDPLDVVPILRVPNEWVTDQPQILDMLGAFFGPGYRDWWLDYTRDIEYVPPFRNHWLVRRSVARSFRHGLVKLDRQQPSMIEYEVKCTNVGPEEEVKIDGNFALLGDHSRQRVPTVDPRLIGTHARLAESIRFLDLGDKFSLEDPDQPPPPTASLIRRLFDYNPFTSLFMALWRQFPCRVRATAYDWLGKVGMSLFGRPHGTVQRLPFGLYLKYHGEATDCRNEFNALNMVRKETTIPAPRALDAVCGSNGSPSYLLMTKVAGMPLNECVNVISDTNLSHIGHQLGLHLLQLRTIKKKTQSAVAISDTLGGPCRDPRIRGGQSLGPFADEQAFNQCLMFPDHPSRQGHEIYFSHADLNPRNILVRQVRGSKGAYTWVVSGIVDWEGAGYYPEYWDSTKAMFEMFRWPARYNEFIKGAFKRVGDYSSELETEIESWGNGDGV